MNSKRCKEIQAGFSLYLDGAMSGREMLEVSEHVEGAAGGQGCRSCAEELAAWRQTQSAVAAIGQAKAPADLALKLRIAISHEKARRDSRWMDRVSLAWDNAIRPRLVQVSAGFAGSLVLGAAVLLLGVVAAPQPVLANDEPLGAITAPHYLYSTFTPGDTAIVSDTPVVVEASIDAAGRVYDFTILSGPKDEAVRTAVADQLLSSVFQPASAFGLPVRGRAVMTFDSVRG